MSANTLRMQSWRNTRAAQSAKSFQVTAELDADRATSVVSHKASDRDRSPTARQIPGGNHGPASAGLLISPRHSLSEERGQTRFEAPSLPSLEPRVTAISHVSHGDLSTVQEEFSACGSTD